MAIVGKHQNFTMLEGDTLAPFVEQIEADQGGNGVDEDGDEGAAAPEAEAPDAAAADAPAAGGDGGEPGAAPGGDGAAPMDEGQ